MNAYYSKNNTYTWYSGQARGRNPEKNTYTWLSGQARGSNPDADDFISVTTLLQSIKNALLLFLIPIVAATYVPILSLFYIGTHKTRANVSYLRIERSLGPLCRTREFIYYPHPFKFLLGMWAQRSLRFSVYVRTFTHCKPTMRRFPAAPTISQTRTNLQIMGRFYSEPVYLFPGYRSTWHQIINDTMGPKVSGWVHSGVFFRSMAVGMQKTGAIPRINDLNNVPMLPTQSLVLTPSKFAQNGPSLACLGSTDFESVNRSIADELGNVLQANTVVQLIDNAARVELAELACNQVLSTALADTFEVRRRPGKSETIPWPIAGDLDILRSPSEADKIRKTVTRFSEHRYVDPASFVNTIQPAFQRADEKFRLVRWWTCLWLDFLIMMHLRDFAGGAREFGGAGAHGYGAPHNSIPHTADVVNEVTQAQWGDLFNNTAFFMDASWFGQHPETISHAMRYAQTYPPERIRYRTAAGDARYPIAGRYNIPGTNDVHVHYGVLGALPAAVPALLNFIDPERILSLAKQMLLSTASYNACYYGFQIASNLGIANNSYYMHYRATGQDNASSQENWTNALLTHSNIWLPQDETAALFFMPYYLKSMIASPCNDILSAHNGTIFRLMRQIHGCTALSTDAATKALSLTGAVFLSIANRPGVPLHAITLELLVLKRANLEISGFDATTMNATAIMFGWRCSREVFRCRNYTDAEPAHFRPDNWMRTNETACFAIPYNWAEYMIAIPDYMVLPFTNGVVKWPSEKAYPVANALLSPQINLGYTLLPIGRRLYLGDGGSEYSAQYYMSQRFANPNAPSIHTWAKRYEYGFPVAAAAINHTQMPAPLQQFMRPSSLTTYDHVLRRPRAFGVADAAGPGGGNLVTNLIATQTPNLCTRVRLLNKRRWDIDYDADIDYALYELHDIDGEAMRLELRPLLQHPVLPILPQPAAVLPPQPQAVTSGPAAPANSNNPNEPPAARQDTILTGPQGVLVGKKALTTTIAKKQYNGVGRTYQPQKQWQEQKAYNPAVAEKKDTTGVFKNLEILSGKVKNPVARAKVKANDAVAAQAQQDMLATHKGGKVSTTTVAYVKGKAAEEDVAVQVNIPALDTAGQRPDEAIEVEGGQQLEVDDMILNV
jgi:hypothetical protein